MYENRYNKQLQEAFEAGYRKAMNEPVNQQLNEDALDDFFEWLARQAERLEQPEHLPGGKEGEDNSGDTDDLNPYYWLIPAIERLFGGGGGDGGGQPNPGGGGVPPTGGPPTRR